MTVTCPNCKTTYNLADDKARPGAKLRCTVCRQVFVLPDSSESTPSGDISGAASSARDSGTGQGTSLSIESTARPKKKSRKLSMVVMVLFVLLAATGLLWQYTTLLDPLKNTLGLVKSAPKELTEAERAARLADLVGKLELRDVRPYLVHNDKIDGNISVIEGKIINGFDQPRSFIRVEASLYDDAGTLLISKNQLAGSMVSLFQLQVLSEQELENALGNNKLDILANNTNVPPGGTVPFMLVFYNPPEAASDFSVRVVGAALPEAVNPAR
ncbi:MAG: zinc-ribbon domain-containing protein [Desulfovibrionaceae bacterium]|nr:zinc-ribbon domain-containing protein [Desulfovibrionaceae bacterium]